MKRITALLITGLLLLSLLAGCGGNSKGSAADADFTWTREGSFEDADGNYLLLTPSDTEGYEGWAVTFMLGEDVHGWIIEQEGKTLHGDLDYEDNSAFIVTISEEGEDGLLLETEDGDVYHFVPMNVPEASVIVNINTEGLGQIAYAPEGETPEFDEEYPTQSAQLNLESPETYVIAAKADAGWRFVKWTKDGEDFATDAEITVELSEEHVEYVAVFEAEQAS